MPEGHRVRSLGVAVLSCLTTCCGGGAPLLHPAHALPAGHVSAGAGVSGQFVFRSAEPPRAPGPPPPMGETVQRGVEDAVARVALSPGVAPWVAVRGGLGARTEAGITYTGRTVRADARHAFGGDAVALSVGAGASGVFARSTDGAETGSPPPPPERLPLVGPELAANGYGFDVPIVVGWRSTASVVQVWAGARGGFERVAGDLPFVGVEGGAPLPPASFTATRWWGGGLVGAAVGLPPLMVAIELDVAYQAASGSATLRGPGAAAQPSEGTVTGLTLAPAGAIIGKF